MCTAEFTVLHVVKKISSISAMMCCNSLIEELMMTKFCANTSHENSKLLLQLTHSQKDIDNT